jgi:TatD DNase family protein
MNMTWIDSHAHIDMADFDADRDAVVARAQAAGIRSLLCPVEAASEEIVRKALDIKKARPDFILMAAGVHPHQGKHFEGINLSLLRRLRAENEIVAIGEIGLDYHYDFSSPEEQRTAFREQLRLAREIDLPVIIHSRLAGHDVLAAVREERPARGGILHCFTEDTEFALRMVDLGFLISFSGILTFPKAGDLRKTAAEIPLERLLVETDAPFLAPVPYRGAKRNEPAFLIETARVLAGLKRVPLETLAETTTRNFQEFFGLKA